MDISLFITINCIYAVFNHKTIKSGKVASRIRQNCISIWVPILCDLNVTRVFSSCIQWLESPPLVLHRLHVLPSDLSLFLIILYYYLVTGVLLLYVVPVPVVTRVPAYVGCWCDSSPYWWDSGSLLIGLESQMTGIISLNSAAWAQFK